MLQCAADVLLLRVGGAPAAPPKKLWSVRACLQQDTGWERRVPGRQLGQRLYVVCARVCVRVRDLSCGHRFVC